jgi:hypothetical protein
MRKIDRASNCCVSSKAATLMAPNRYSLRLKEIIGQKTDRHISHYMGKMNMNDSVTVSHEKNLLAYIGRIQAAWHRATESILEVGSELNDAKSALSTLEFRKLKTELEDQRIMSAPTISKLMTIASDNRLTSPARAKLLPPSYNTIYELTRVGDKELSDAFKAGVITPETERSFAKGLRSSVNDAQQIPNSETNLFTVSADLDNIPDSTVSDLRKLLAKLSKDDALSVKTTTKFEKL